MISLIAVRSAHRPARDERGSMAFFMVLAVVGLAIAALLVPLVVSSSRTTRSDTSRVHALDAAQAGVNVMLGAIRAAQSSDGVGQSEKLPCTPMSGQVNSVGDAAYTVEIRYFLVDPKTIAPADREREKMVCADGYGTYKDNVFTPRYAEIVAVGTDGEAVNGTTPGRTLRTTYAFRTTASPVLGAQIPLSAATGVCIDAGSATPAAGAAVTLQSCATPSIPQQVFAYRTDLSLQLVSSVTSTNANGMCIDVPAPPAANGAVVMQRCGALGSPVYTQQWSYGDPGGSYQAATADSARTGTLSNLCFNVASQAAGTPLRLATCTGNAAQGWTPATEVGPGGADDPQLVNFEEYGRCLDVTYQDVNQDHLISYQCKQNPNAASILWNQRWDLPDLASGGVSATGRIITTPPNSTAYCLTSPVNTGAYVTVATCNANNTRQSWTVYRGSSTLPYSTRYTITDSTGRCLGLTTPKSGEPWSAITVETCNGAADHKWNAIADPTIGALQDTTEVRG